jgi:hypothetical protein
MKLSSILAPLFAKKADHETIMAVVLAYEAEQADALERRRETDRLRQAAKAERDRQSRDSREPHDGGSSHAGVTRVEDKPLTLEDNQQEESKKALRSEFDSAFWPEYPHKVGKPKAFLEFVAARKRAELSAIIEGLRRYVASKPADRAWLNPATFLHQDRFNDQPGTVLPMARGSPRRNPLMDRLNELTRPPNDDDPEPSQAAVLQLPATAYR